MAHPLSDGARSSNDRSSRGLNAHKAYWVDPCRGDVPTASSERRSSDQLGPADNDTLNAIYKTTLEARNQAEKFRDEYVSTRKLYN